MCMYILPTKYKFNGFKHGVWMKAYWQHSLLPVVMLINDEQTQYIHVWCICQYFCNNKIFHLIIMYWLCFPGSNSQVCSARPPMVDGGSIYGSCQIIIRKAWLIRKKSRNIIAATQTLFVTTQLSILLQWRSKVANLDDPSNPSLLYIYYICIVLVLIIAKILLTGS
jgi:hypothetical protein